MMYGRAKEDFAIFCSLVYVAIHVHVVAGRFVTWVEKLFSGSTFSYDCIYIYIFFLIKEIRVISESCNLIAITEQGFHM